MKILLFLLLSVNILAIEPYQYKAEVLEVHDGDTITACIKEQTHLIYYQRILFTPYARALSNRHRLTFTPYL